MSTFTSLSYLQQTLLPCRFYIYKLNKQDELLISSVLLPFDKATLVVSLCAQPLS